MVTKLVSKLPKEHSYKLYIHNFITPPRILDKLETVNISVTGSVTAIKKYPLKYCEEMKKDSRGTKWTADQECWQYAGLIKMSSVCYLFIIIIEILSGLSCRSLHCHLYMRPYTCRLQLLRYSAASPGKALVCLSKFIQSHSHI